MKTLAPPPIPATRYKGRLEWPLLPSGTHVVVPLVAPVQPLH